MASTTLDNVKAMLGLSKRATRQEVIARIEELLPPDEEEEDAREVLRERAERLAREKAISFGQALNELKEKEPRLIEEVAALYARTK